jgi:glycosyltransferase involved in cell wall biosynthesis
MKILLTADPELPVPPGLYGGIERIVEVLIEHFVEAGHDVTLCANPASKVPCKLVSWKGAKSQNKLDTVKNLATFTKLVYSQKFDIVHSFSRLAYMTAAFPLSVPKIMSYQREPSLSQIKKAAQLSRKGSMVFTGCSDYISNQISTVAEAYTIYNCAPYDKYTLVENVEEDAPLIFLGRIEPIKGTHIAVDIARKSGRKLIIAGNIPADKESYFEKEIKPWLNDRIQYVGPVNDKQKNELLGKADAFLMPIQWNEPFGIVMAEAMACGTPVLGFPFGSVPEVVNDGISGFICKDAGELLQKLQSVKSINRKQVRESSIQRFGNEAIASNYLELYQKLISRRKK